MCALLDKQYRASESEVKLLYFLDTRFRVKDMFFHGLIQVRSRKCIVKEDVGWKTSRAGKHNIIDNTAFSPLVLISLF